MKKEKKEITTASSRQTEAGWHTAFCWQNYVLTAMSVLFIVTGLLLMLPEQDVRNTVCGRYAATPGPGAFDARHIRAAPVPCFIGFILMVPAIMYVPEKEEKRGGKAVEM